MAMATAPHIKRDDRGVAWIDETNVKVIEVVLDRLGLTPRTSKPDFINFDWGGVRLSVGVHDRVGGTSRDPLRLMVNLTVTDIRAVHDRLARAGIVFTRAPEREDWGGWVATLADPDGNVLQLMQLP